MPLDSCWTEIAPGFAAHVARPTGTSPRPAIVMLTEIFGINALMRETAASWATDGFLTVTPDLYWRTAPGIELEYEGPDRERAFGMYAKFDHETGTEDALAAVKHARSLPACDGRVFVIGYCFGGTLAWLAAARGGIDGAAALYATKVHDYLGRTADIACPISLHYGDEDPLVAAETVVAIEAAVAANPRVDFHLYPGLGHAFMNRLRPSYSPEGAARARGEILSAFQALST